MSGGEKERLIAFKNRIKQLELQLDEKNDLLNQYEAIGNAADQKIAALNSIHSDKIRSLMNSIQLLKKENANLKQLSKEHKRSQLIEQLNQEVKDQDIVISALREAINDDAKSDNAIVKALNAGPPKIKSLTREELKVENKKLSTQILTLKQQVEKGKGGQGDMKDSQVSKASTQHSKQGDDNKSVNDEPSKLDTNDNLIRRIEELKNENEDLKLNLKAEEDIRAKYEEEISRRGQELNELRSAKTDLIVMNKKYEFLQKQLDSSKSAQTNKQVTQMNKDLEMEEIQIINKTQGGKLQMAEKNLRIEVDALQVKTEQAIREKEEMQQEYTKVLVKSDELNKRFNDIQVKFMATREENNKIKSVVETKTSYFEKQIQTLLEQQTKLQTDIGDRDTTLVQANLRIEQLTKLNDDMTIGLRQLEGKIQHIKSPDQDELEIDRQIQDLLRKQDGNKLTNQVKDQELARKLVIQKEFYEGTIRDLQKRLIVSDQNYNQNLSNISSNVSQLLEKVNYKYQQKIKQEQQSGLDDLDSDVSGSVYKKHQIYGGHYGMLQNQDIEGMNSDINSILDSQEQKMGSQQFLDCDSQVSLPASMLKQEHELLKAPKPVNKYANISHVSQIDSSIGSLVSQKQQNASQMNSSIGSMISQQQHLQKQDIDNMSSGVSNMSFSRKSAKQNSNISGISQKSHI